MQFQRLEGGKWAHVGGKTYHKHDVRAMSSFDSAQTRMIVSGGIPSKVTVANNRCGSNVLGIVICRFRGESTSFASCSTRKGCESCWQG